MPVSLSFFLLFFNRKFRKTISGIINKLYKQNAAELQTKSHRLIIPPKINEKWTAKKAEKSYNHQRTIATTMEVILDGNSEIGAHVVWNEIRQFDLCKAFANSK